MSTKGEYVSSVSYLDADFARVSPVSVPTQAPPCCRPTLIFSILLNFYGGWWVLKNHHLSKQNRWMPS